MCPWLIGAYECTAPSANRGLIHLPISVSWSDINCSSVPRNHGWGQALMFATWCPTNSSFVSEFVGRAVRKKHFLLLKALSLWRRWVTVIAGLFPLWEFPEMLRETCEKRGSAYGETEARGGSMASGDFPLHCVALTSAFGRTGCKAVTTTPRPCFHGPFFPEEFSSCQCPSAGPRAGDQQIQVAVLWSMLDSPWHSQLPPATFSSPAIYPQVFFLTFEMVNLCPSASALNSLVFINMWRQQ